MSQWEPDIDGSTSCPAALTLRRLRGSAAADAGLTGLLTGLANNKPQTSPKTTSRGLVSRTRIHGDTGVSLHPKVHLTLSLMFSAVSGSPPPPPRFLSSVMFRSSRPGDVNVSHKPTQRAGRWGGRGRGRALGF
ncbi:hypothetical protein ILYODFUR_031314 [Ilyodon furcidens]|uniref:Uncharacterized protein n=1 Tax=Ilyodon furcidens TaxID=33524 RepID=A0ABV0UYL1_9TELE